MKIKLPIILPPITSHQFYALPLSIISNNRTAFNWVYSEFMQLFTYRGRENEYTEIRFYKDKNDMFGYEPLNDTRIQSKLSNDKNIIEFYKYFLDSGKYIYDFVDKYYINSLKVSWHLHHDLLIYGYNDDKKTFNVYAYNELKLSEFEVPYNEYIAAYNSEYNKFHLTILYKLKEEEYKIDINKIKWYLLDYMEGINTYNRENLFDVKLYKPQFGINIYDELIYMFNYHRNLKLYIKIPDLYCFYEHKKLMSERLLYLNNNSEIKCNNELVNDFKDIYAEAFKVIMLILKLNERNFENKNDFNRLLSHIDNIRDKETVAYNKYYEYNKYIFNNL